MTYSCTQIDNKDAHFPKMVHSGSAARIISEQNNSAKSNTYCTWYPISLVALLLESRAFPTVLIPISLKTEPLFDPF